MNPKLEIACFNAESARIAFASGADRIEICSGFEEGGLTPDFDMVELLVKEIHIPIFVMIRPRGGNFLYTHDEFNRMKLDLQRFKTLQIQGFVFGILDAGHNIDLDRNNNLVTLAAPFPCTFHRAFDRSKDYKNSLEGVIQCGFKTLLTSGCQSNALNGVKELNELIALAKKRIEIMPGGGVRSSNIQTLHTSCTASFYHSSAILNPTNRADAEEINNLKVHLNNAKS